MMQETLRNLCKCGEILSRLDNATKYILNILVNRTNDETKYVHFNWVTGPGGPAKSDNFLKVVRLVRYYYSSMNCIDYSETQNDGIWAKRQKA